MKNEKPPAEPQVEPPAEPQTELQTEPQAEPQAEPPGEPQTELQTEPQVEPPAEPQVGQASRLSEHSWRRHLPHIQLSAGYYFITFTTHNRQFLHPSHKDCVFEAIRFLDGKSYELYAVVVLDDHVHMVINPIDTLSKIMHSIKSFTAHEINKVSNRSGKLWHDENFDSVIRDEKELLEKLNYIANNPIKANLVEEYEEYKWLYIKGWINDYK
ncbi:MAG: transposase [Nitrospirae bacterium]|nr:transposase [Nitrospirota bacterium]